MEQDADPETAGMRVEARIFLGIAAFLMLITAVYWLTSFENAGTTMLLLAGGMALTIGAYLAFQTRRGSDAAEPERDGGGGAAEPAVDHGYLPHASIWPFGVGMGLVVMANGLALGLWAVIPGALLAGSSLWGYARQSRRRD